MLAIARRRNLGKHIPALLLALFSFPLVSCSSSDIESQPRPRVTETALDIRFQTPEQPSPPEDEFDLSIISSACVKQYPGIKLSVEDEESDDPIVRIYIVDVQEILRLMYQANFLSIDPGPADGVFGPMTDKAVRNYQKTMNITVDGIVGQETWLTFPQACEIIASEVAAHSDLG